MLSLHRQDGHSHGHDAALDVAGPAERGEDELAPLGLARDTFDTILLMGNNLGLAGDMAGPVAMLRRLRQMSHRHGVIIAGCRSPAGTENPAHLAYHQRNRDRGRPIGQITLRVEYGGQSGPRVSGPWLDLLMLTPEEDAGVACRSGWDMHRLFRGERGLSNVVLETTG